MERMRWQTLQAGYRRKGPNHSASEEPINVETRPLLHLSYLEKTIHRVATECTIYVDHPFYVFSPEQINNQPRGFRGSKTVLWFTHVIKQLLFFSYSDF